MDPDKLLSTSRKVKFTPKPQPPRKTKASVRPKTVEAEDAAEAQQLLQHLNEKNTGRRRRPRVESKSTIQATFIHGPQQPSTSRISNLSQDGSHGESSGSLFKDDGGKISKVAGFSVMKEDSSPKTEYREPWNYVHSYYPTTLPLRRPYSGDPEILNDAEFGEAATRLEYDERKINPASELGFLDSDEANESTRLMFFQLPQSLPLIKRSATAKGKEKEGTTAVPDQRGSIAPAMGGRGRCCSLKELPAGMMGKLLVYKSGAVKLKLGDTLYDVSPGSDCTFAQEVVTINSESKECCAVGELHKHAVVTPDIESLLGSELALDKP